MSGLSDMLSEGGELKTPKLGDAIGGGTNKELMAEARMALSGNWGMGVVGYVLYFILVVSVSLFTFSSMFFVMAVSAASGANAKLAGDAVSFCSQVVQLLLSGAFMVGFCSYFLVMAQEGEARLECLFTGFKRFWKSFGVYFLTNLFIFLWIFIALLIPLLLLVALSFIPGLDGLLTHKNIAIISLLVGFLSGGLVAALRYAMVYFIIADDEDCGPLEAIRQSKMMMRGNKWKFFCLHWRFFGWAVLCMFTFGIGYLWLVPYMQTTFAKFYEDVK